MKNNKLVADKLLNFLISNNLHINVNIFFNNISYFYETDINEHTIIYDIRATDLYNYADNQKVFVAFDINNPLLVNIDTKNKIEKFLINNSIKYEFVNSNSMQLN